MDDPTYKQSITNINHQNCCFRHYPHYKYNTTDKIFNAVKVKITYGNALPHVIHTKQSYGIIPLQNHSRAVSGQEQLINGLNNAKMVKETSLISESQLFDQVPLQTQPVTNKNQWPNVGSICINTDSRQQPQKDRSQSSRNRDQIISIDPSLNIEDGTGSFGYNLRQGSRTNEHCETLANFISTAHDENYKFLKKSKKVYQSQIQQKQSDAFTYPHKKSTDMLLHTKKRTQQSIQRDEQIMEENQNSQIFIEKGQVTNEQKQKINNDLQNIEMAESKYLYGHVRHSSDPQSSRQYCNVQSNITQPQNYQPSQHHQNSAINNQSPKSQRDSNALKISQVYAYSQQDSVQQIQPLQLKKQQIKEQLNTQPHSKELQSMKKIKRKGVGTLKKIEQVKHSFGLRQCKERIKKQQLKDLKQFFTTQ